VPEEEYARQNIIYVDNLIRNAVASPGTVPEKFVQNAIRLRTDLVNLGPNPPVSSAQRIIDAVYNMLKERPAATTQITYVDIAARQQWKRELITGESRSLYPLVYAEVSILTNGDRSQILTYPDLRILREGMINHGGSPVKFTVLFFPLGTAVPQWKKSITVAQPLEGRERRFVMRKVMFDFPEEKGIMTVGELRVMMEKLQPGFKVRLWLTSSPSVPIEDEVYAGVLAMCDMGGVIPGTVVGELLPIEPGSSRVADLDRPVMPMPTGPRGSVMKR